MGKIVRTVIKPQPSGTLEALGVIFVPFVAAIVLSLVFAELGIVIGVGVALAMAAGVCVAYRRQLKVKWTCSLCGHTLAGPVRLRDRAELPGECPNCKETFEREDE